MSYSYMIHHFCTYEHYTYLLEWITHFVIKSRKTREGHMWVRVKGRKFPGQGRKFLVWDFGPTMNYQCLDVHMFLNRLIHTYSWPKWTPQSFGLMPCDLLFEVYSTNTLAEGLDIVKREVGMDPLTSTEAALAQELQKLKDGSRYNGCLFSTWYAFKIF